MSDVARPFKILARRKKPVWLIQKAWNSLEIFFQASHLPFVTRIHPWFRADKTEANWLPINEDLELPESTPVPLALLDRFIEESCQRVIVDACPCRTFEGCKKYPWDIGCLFLGAQSMDGFFPLVAKKATVEQAKAHARKAIEAGLVPAMGKVRLDNSLIRVRDKGKLMTVCFCCDCCCISGFFKHLPLEDVEPIFPRLDGIVVEVDTEKCNGCGKCVKHCYTEAITVPYGKAQISQYCRACGRCAAVCPQDAITIRIEDPDYIDKAYERIRQYVDVT